MNRLLPPAYITGMNEEENIEMGEREEESEEEVEETEEASQPQRKTTKKTKKTPVPGPNPCIACQRNCTKAQHSVRCTLCELWCHKTCSGLSDEAFKGLDIQQKETGTAFWACKSCLGYAKKVNQQFKRVDERLDGTDRRVEENKKNIETTSQLAQSTAAEVKKLAGQMEQLAEKMEETLDTELRERETRRLNLIIHGVPEIRDSLHGNRERMEEDKRTCEDLFKTLGARTGVNNIRFCRRIGERGQTPRPIVVGLSNEGEKNFILNRAKNLPHTKYSEATIGPDLTKRQRTGEAKLKEEAARRNKQLTQQDLQNNMKWLVIGRKGEKRLIKGVEREFTRAPPPAATYSQQFQPDHRLRETSFRRGFANNQVQQAHQTEDFPALEQRMQQRRQTENDQVQVVGNFGYLQRADQVQAVRAPATTNHQAYTQQYRGDQIVGAQAGPLQQQPPLPPPPP